MLSNLDLDVSTQFDVLVIGGGAAGLYAALCLPTHLQIGLVTKDTLSLSASDWAQGGIAAAIDPADSPSQHAQDTIAAGAGLCEPAVVQFIVEHAAEQIDSLLKLGVAFDRYDAKPALTLEAAHSRPRVLHAADTTGRKLITTLVTEVRGRQNIKILPETFTLSLWLDSQQRHCQGVSLVHRGQITWVRAAAIVLATGGGGQVFARTTNPIVSTGDGVAMAWRAGATLRDLEFFQFHPTALTLPGAPRFLISEAVRGEGAHLIDDQGRRFVFDYHPAGELAPRDVVSRAIFSHLQKTGGLAQPDSTDHVWLDLRPIPAQKVRQQFPKIVQVCEEWGINVFQEPIPVAPAAHYWMGGILTDLQGRTTISGLYAVGEVASTGVHGANRLASNSLLECLVFAAQLADLSQAQQPVESAAGSQSQDVQTELLKPAVQHWLIQQEKLSALRRELPLLVWQNAGICREHHALEAAVTQVETWRAEFAQLPLSQLLLNLKPAQPVKVLLSEADLQIRAWAETSNLLDVALLVLKSARFRTESRGGHYRLDYPQPDPNWQVHTLVQNNNWWKSAPLAFKANLVNNVAK